MGCCEKDSLVTYVRLLSSLQAMCSFIVFVIGAVVGNNDLISRGLGDGTCVAGQIVALLAFFNLCSCACGRFGARSHNKFCLLIFTACQMACTCTILALLSTTLAASADEVDSETTLACSRKGHKESCSEVLYDEGRTKLRDLWKHMYKLSLETDSTGLDFVQLLEDIQTEGNCCGFEPPYACQFGEPTSDGYDTYLSSSEILPKSCGNEKWWYNPTPACDETVDLSSGLYRPGCPYFLPVGRCKVFEYDFGCMHHLRTYLLASFVPLFQTAEGLCSMNIIASVAAFFLLLKRKDHDVLPTTYIVSKRAIVK